MNEHGVSVTEVTTSLFHSINLSIAMWPCAVQVAFVRLKVLYGKKNAASTDAAFFYLR